MSQSYGESVVRLHSPVSCKEAMWGTGFLVHNPELAPYPFLVTNTHVIEGAVAPIDIVNYTTGQRIVGRVDQSAFISLPADRQDLAVAAISSSEVAPFAHPWHLLPASSVVAAGLRLQACGFPDKGVNFEETGSPLCFDAVVQQGSTDFSLWGRSFFVNGPWGPGLSGSPVFAIDDQSVVLIGINRGLVREVQQADGSWAPVNLSRIIEAHHLLGLVSQLVEP